MTVSPGLMFWISLRLGLTSFGGPIAHLAYFRDEFVARRRWLDEDAYADLVALSQFVPGPASSQTLYVIGLLRGGFWGGVAAWLGFTLPSAILMLFAAYGLQFASGQTAQGLIHGLKIVAVAVVAQAIWSMARSLCPDRARAGIALVATAVLVAAPSTVTQLGVMAFGAVAGWMLVRPAAPVESVAPPISGPSRTAGGLALIIFVMLLLGLPLALTFAPSAELTAFEAFYRAGALVFGGGHVVLPLLEEAVVAPGAISQEAFLAGYGAAQALPGPLFTFAAYLGGLTPTSIGPVGGAVLATIAIFLPGILLIYGALPFWAQLRSRPSARAVLGGVNAAVVCVLAAALYDPIAISAITRPLDLSLALLALAALTVWRAPTLAVVVATAIGGILVSS